MRKTFNKKTKDKRLKIAKQHQEADRFIQGKRLKKNKTDEGMHRGCLFGCMMQTQNNVLKTASKNMNLPERIVHMSEKIFEGLPKKEAVLRPVQLLEEIPTNKDTEKSWKRLMQRILIDENYGNIAFANGREDVIDAIKQCAALYDMDVIDESAAESAAESANSAWSAAESVNSAWYAAESAWSAANSARYAADSAWYAADSAWYAAESAARSAGSARSERYQRIRGVMIEELQRED